MHIKNNILGDFKVLSKTRQIIKVALTLRQKKKLLAYCVAFLLGICRIMNVIRY